MPPKQQKHQKQKQQNHASSSHTVGSHPQIHELDNLQDFTSYIGAAKVPQKPLIDQIAQLQAQRDERLNSSTTTSAATDQLNPTITTPQRYRRKPASSSSTASSTTPTFDRDTDLSATGRFLFDILDYSTYLIPIISVHLVLDILVRVQYSEDTFEMFAQRDVLKRAVMAIPVFAILHTFVHPLRHTRAFRIISFFASVVTGGYLLYAGNEEGYYYIMKRAPPLGTLWVWMFVEMEWQWAAVSLVVMVFWMWLKDYSI